ncbi:hypothetical protein Tco_0598728 [Tanacetum coccineum]
MVIDDKSWTLLERHERAFYIGLEKFVDHCKLLVNSAGKIRCPCKSCRTILWVSIKPLSDHIMRHGFDLGYKTWVHHDEQDLPPPPPVMNMTTLLNDLSYIPPNNEHNEPTQGDIELKKVKWYVLHNNPEIDTYRSQFKSLFPNKDMQEEFPDWFGSQIRQRHVDNDQDPEVSTTSELFALANGPSWTPISVNSCVVDGVRYVVHSRDERRTTQNSGICSPGPDGEMYYGQLQEIIEFKYLLFKVALFRVKWFDTSNKGRKVNKLVLRNNMTQINCSREAFKDDQYILVTQVKQVFYLEDKTKPHWKVVEHVNHKKFSDGGVIVVEDDPDIIHFDNSSDLPLSTSLNDLNNATLHIDGQSTVVDAPPDIIDVPDEDDDIIGDEDALPYDLADSDVEDLINVDDDGVEKMSSADVARSYEGDGGGDDRPPSHVIVPPKWTPEKRRFFSKVKNNFWDEPCTFRLCPDNVMRRCIAGNKILKILAHCHSGPTGRHHSASVTGRKDYGSRFFWPSIFKYAKDYVMNCGAFAAKNRFMELNELMELKDGAYENTRIYKERTKIWHDSGLRGDKDFKFGDKVLLFNSRFKMHPGKLKSRCNYGVLRRYCLYVPALHKKPRRNKDQVFRILKLRWLWPTKSYNKFPTLNNFDVPTLKETHDQAVWINNNGEVKKISIKELSYSLCGKEGDYVQNLFFQCDYSRKKLKCKNNIMGVIKKVSIAVVVYNIWRERNLKTFQQKKRDEDAIIKIVKDDVKWKLASLKVKKSSAVTKVFGSTYHHDHGIADQTMTDYEYLGVLFDDRSIMVKGIDLGGWCGMGGIESVCKMNLFGPPNTPSREDRMVLLRVGVP